MNVICKVAVSLAVGVGLYPLGATAGSVSLEEFSISVSGSIAFRDRFDDGAPPPSAPNFLSGNAASYGVIGSFQAGAEANGRLTLDSSNGAASLSPEGVPIHAQIARLLTNTDLSSSLGLKSDRTFQARALFDLPTAVASGEAFGLRFSDLPISQSNDLVSLRIGSLDGNANAISLAKFNYSAGTTIGIASSFIDFNSHDQVELILSRDNIHTGLVRASYRYWFLGSPVGAEVSLVDAQNVATIFNGEDWTRAEVFAARIDVASVPEPTSVVLLLSALAFLGVFIGVRQRSCRELARGNPTLVTDV